MSVNPFDDDSGGSFVFVHDEEQHSLRPTFADIPAGWWAPDGEADRGARFDYIEQHLVEWPADVYARKVGSRELIDPAE